MKFNKDFFAIIQWTGDKYIEGRYAETTLDPDLQLELKLENKRYPVAVKRALYIIPVSAFKNQFSFFEQEKGELRNYPKFD